MIRPHPEQATTCANGADFASCRTFGRALLPLAGSPMADTSPVPGSAPLNGWKQIAAYFGRSVRAVQRYEHELGLPVHRIKTADGQSVYALPGEIDDWRRGVDASIEPDKTAATVVPSSSAEDSPGLPASAPDITSNPTVIPTTQSRTLPGGALFWLGIGVAITLALLLSVGLDLAHSGGSDPHHIRWNGRVLEAVGSDERLVWSYPLDRDVTGPLGLDSQSQLILDLDRDGRMDVLVPVRFGPAGGKAVSTDVLMAFSSAGRLLWTVKPDFTITCGYETFAGPWEVRALLASEDDDGSRRVWLAYVHHTWRPSFILEVTNDGHSSVRYVQAGWIFSMADWTTPAGRFLVAGGTSNEHKRPSVVLIDLASRPTALPAATARDQCGDNSSDGVRKVFLMPPLETTDATNPHDDIQKLRIVGPDLKATYEGAQAILRLSPELRVVEYVFADVYATTHRSLEQRGLLDHPAETCPFAKKDKEIREWTAETGWQTSTIRPLR
jgi:hypothetical protein